VKVRRRRFIVVTLSGPADGEFSLNDLAGSAGRLDILCRCVGAALLISHGIRRDSEVHLLILKDPERPRLISIYGDRVRSLNPDERSTASLLRIALSSREEKETTPGITIRNIGLEQLIHTLQGTNIFLLEEKGDNAWDTIPHTTGEEFTFILGARDDIPPALRDKCLDFHAVPISISPLSLQSEQCITIIHNILDRLSTC